MLVHVNCIRLSVNGGQTNHRVAKRHLPKVTRSSTRRNDAKNADGRQLRANGWFVRKAEEWRCLAQRDHGGAQAFLVVACISLDQRVPGRACGRLSRSADKPLVPRNGEHVCWLRAGSLQPPQ